MEGGEREITGSCSYYIHIDAMTKFQDFSHPFHQAHYGLPQPSQGSITASLARVLYVNRERPYSEFSGYLAPPASQKFFSEKEPSPPPKNSLYHKNQQPVDELAGSDEFPFATFSSTVLFNMVHIFLKIVQRARPPKTGISRGGATQHGPADKKSLDKKWSRTFCQITRNLAYYEMGLNFWFQTSSYINARNSTAHDSRQREVLSLTREINFSPLGPY